MTALLEFQRAFSASLFDRADPWPEATVVARGLTAQRRMDVYRNNVFSSLIEALGALFPVVRELVGPGFFAYAADSHLRAAPPRHGTLIDFGTGFADFLEAFPAARDVPYLADVARLELAWHQAFHAADETPLTPDALAALPPERLPELRLRPHAACRWLRSDYPACAVWRAHQTPDASARVDLAAGPEHALLSRPEAEVTVQAVEPAAWILLQSVADGAQLGAACAMVLENLPDADLQAALATLLAAGAFATADPSEITP